VRAGPFIAPLYPMTSHTKLPEGDFPKPVYVVFLISYPQPLSKGDQPPSRSSYATSEDVRAEMAP